MQISSKFLNIPSYVSTSWKNVLSLHTDNQGALVITLNNQAQVLIPHLHPREIEVIFTAHSKFFEEETKKEASIQNPFRFFFRIDSSSLSEPFGSALKHSPEYAEMPHLPPSLLQNLTGMLKTLGIEDPAALPCPESGCNCLHCQISSALHAEIAPPQEEQEEIVSEEDLQFRDWQIEKTAEHLYTVTHPLFPKEQYSVFLGNPVGCTCGEKHCEHIQSVLRS